MACSPATFGRLWGASPAHHILLCFGEGGREGGEGGREGGREGEREGGMEKEGEVTTSVACSPATFGRL